MQELTRPRRGLKKFIRQPAEYDKRNGCFTLTERDRYILDLIYRYRAMELQHLVALTPGETKQISKRVQGLFHHGFVSRHTTGGRSRVDLDLSGSPPMIYQLDTAGWRELPEHHHGPLPWRKEQTRRSQYHLGHQVELTDFHTTLEVALRGRGDLPLLEWRQDHLLQDSFTFKVKGTTTRKRAGLKPDAYYAVDEAGTRRNFFLEIDMGTEEHSRLQSKFQTYYNYVRSSAYHSRYADRNPEDVRILIVAKTGSGMARRADEDRAKGRFERMLDTLTTIRGKGSLGQFWFAEMDAYQLSEPESILRPIWTSVSIANGTRHDSTRQLFA